MKILAYPKTSTNPYIGILYEELGGFFDVEGTSYKLRPSDLKKSYDFFHFHWVNFAKGKAHRALIKSIIFILKLLVLRSKNCKIIWTFHNAETLTHTNENPGVEKLLRFFLFRICSKIIVHSEFQVRYFDTKWHSKVYHIEHHNYCSVLSSSEKTPGQKFVTFGSFLPYRGATDVLKALELRENNFPFLFAGRFDPHYLDALKEMKMSKQIEFDNRFLPDEELYKIVSSAQCVVLPFKRITNSGALVLALSCRTPVIISKNQLSDEFLRRFPTLKEVVVTYSTLSEMNEAFKKMAAIEFDSSAFDDYIVKTDIKVVGRHYKNNIFVK